MSNDKSRAIISFVVVLVTVLVVVGAIALKPTAASQSAQQTVSPATNTSVMTQPANMPGNGSMMNSSGMQYANGTYTTTAVYDTPEGNESMGVTITINGDTVVNTSATKMSRSRESRAYQEDFIANYTSLVVGKKLSNLRLGIVAGASLTTIGFNDALDTIRTQAKA